MRDDIDKLIEEALSAEDQALLERLGPNAGFFGQMAGAFRGSGGGIMLFLFIFQGLMALLGIYLAVCFFKETHVLMALHYGFTALALLVLGAIMKMAVGMRAETNRAIREIKRLELQVAMLKAKE